MVGGAVEVSSEQNNNPVLKVLTLQLREMCRNTKSVTQCEMVVRAYSMEEPALLGALGGLWAGERGGSGLRQPEGSGKMEVTAVIQGKSSPFKVVVDAIGKS